MTDSRWIEEDRGHTTPCRVWRGARSGHYGWVSTTRQFAHRAIWEEVNGPIDGPMHIHHRCGEKMCVRVDHLELRSPTEHRRLHSESKKPSRLDRDAVNDIREGGDLLSVVAERYGISKSYAAKVRRGLEPIAFRLETPREPWEGGRHKPPRQKGHLTPEEIDYIRGSDLSLGLLAEMFSMSKQYMGLVKRGLAPKP